MNQNEKYSIYYETAIDFVNHSSNHSEWYQDTKAMQPSSQEEYFRATNNWLDGLARKVGGADLTTGGF